MRASRRAELVQCIRQARGLAQGARADTERRARAKRPPGVASDPGLAVLAQLALSVERLAEATEQYVRADEEDE